MEKYLTKVNVSDIAASQIKPCVTNVAAGELSKNQTKMKKVTYNEAKFSEVFGFAKEVFKKSWNESCDIFHSTDFFTYRGIDDFHLGDLEAEAESLKEDEDYAEDDYYLAHVIMIAYMKDRKVTKCRIDSR